MYLHVMVETTWGVVDLTANLALEHTLVVLPCSFSHFSIDSKSHSAIPMKFSIFKLSQVVVSISQNKSSMAIELWVFEMPLVNLAMREAHAAEAIWLHATVHLPTVGFFKKG